MSFVQKVLAAVDQGDLTSAQALLQKAFQQDTDDDLYDLAEALNQRGISDQAALIYQHLLDKYPQEDILKVNLAEILVSNNQMDAATDLLAQISEDSPAYLNALLTSADLYQSMGLYEVSEQKLLTALKIAPQESVVQFAMAELYFTENKFQLAITFYEKLLAAQITEMAGISIHERLAASYAGTGNYEQAVQQYRQVQAALLNTDNLYNYARLEYELHNYSAAKRLVQQLLQQAPDYSAAYVLAVRLANQQHDFATAVKMAQLGLNYDPFNQLLYQMGAKAAVQLGSLATAQQLLTTGISQVSEPGALIMQLSDLFLRQNDHTANLKLLDQYQTTLAQEPRYHWNKARSLFQQEHVDDALQEMLLVYQTYQADPNYLRDLIQILQVVQKPQLLKNALQKYLHYVPDDSAMVELLDELQFSDEN